MDWKFHAYTVRMAFLELVDLLVAAEHLQLAKYNTLLIPAIHQSFNFSGSSLVLEVVQCLELMGGASCLLERGFFNVEVVGGFASGHCSQLRGGHSGRVSIIVLINGSGDPFQSVWLLQGVWSLYRGTLLSGLTVLLAPSQESGQLPFKMLTTF